LQDGYSHVREVSAYTLGEIRDARAVNPLCSILSGDFVGLNIESIIKLSKDRNAKVRYIAAYVLGNTGPSAVEILMAYLNDEQENVRKIVIRALGTIGDKRAVEPLCTALHDPSLWVRKEAEVALKKLGGIGQA
jgi:HEAT repeat protein